MNLADKTLDSNLLSPRCLRALQKYGVETCIAAFEKNRYGGEGPRTIAETTTGLTNLASANAAIDAGCEISTGYQVGYGLDLFGLAKFDQGRRSKKMTLRDFIEEVGSIDFIISVYGRSTQIVTVETLDDSFTLYADNAMIRSIRAKIADLADADVID